MGNVKGSGDLRRRLIMWGSYCSYWIYDEKGEKLAERYKASEFLSGNEPFFKSSFGCNTYVVLAIQVTPEMTNGGLHSAYSKQRGRGMR
jgi:hypothetical protein